MAQPSQELDPRAAGAKRLARKFAVVTGSGQGIGRATARRLAEEGATVMVADRNPSGAERTWSELREHGAAAERYVVDVSTWEGAQELMAHARKSFGRIDILVNNAGGPQFGGKPYWEYTPEQVVQEVQNNFWTTLWCCRAVLPIMLEQGSGSIVNVGAAVTRSGNRVAYAAAKGGVFATTTSLAKEVADKGIRVNCVAPNATTVEDRLVARNLKQTVEEDAAAIRQRAADSSGSTVPMGRRSYPEEQAAAIAFLASEDASYITGQILSVAGGATVP